ncbi:hypothetical protein ACIGO8_08295 [Streptomyces sp. NPDC053493]|uniref:hypothetical protein n=1 Tax=Streptomyces sp. NPDC053493 TaxID=3365705 RepID=UPI0037D5B9CE
MTAVIVASCVVIAIAAISCWLRDQQPAPYRSRDQVLDDVARYRAQRRMQEAIDSLRTCREIYNLPAASPRKETGQ